MNGTCTERAGCLRDDRTHFSSNSGPPSLRTKERPNLWTNLSPFLLVLLLVLFTALFVGCKTPDLRPFRDSTAQIHNSVVEAQDAYLQELQRLQPYVPDNSELAKQSKRFSTNWEARVAVMEGMVRYASSLAAVAGAPDEGKAGLENVAQAVKELGVLGGPYGPAIEGAADLLTEFKFLADKVASAKQLKQAVSATDDDVQKLAQLLALDFGKTRRALEENQKSIKNLMDGPFSAQLDTRQVIENKVTGKTRDLQKKLGLIQEDADQKKAADPQHAAEIQKQADANSDAAIAAFNQETVEAKKFLADADKWYLPHQADVALAQKELAERIKLFRDTEAALVQWGKTHHALAVALQNNLAPDWTLLQQSADRIEKSINQITGKTGTP